MHILKPPPVLPGDVIGVVAPSLPLLPHQQAAHERGKQVLRAWGYGVAEGRSVGPRRWWSAGTPVDIAADLNAMFADPDIKAIIAHGGFSAMAVLDRIDYSLVRAYPKPFLGISDITVYHLALFARCGLVGFQALDLTPGLGQFWPETGQPEREYLAGVYRALLAGQPLDAFRPLTAWACWRPGRASGPLIGGCLKRVAALAGTPYFPPLTAFDGALFFWEEIGETLYDISLNLHKLRHLGILDRIAGMVVGKLTWVNEYFKEIEHPSPREAVLDALDGHDFPILAEVDYGHNIATLPLPIGVRAEIDAGALHLRLLEPAVA